MAGVQNNNRFESNVIDFNVGGKEFSVSKSTLTKKWKKPDPSNEDYPTNLFEDMVSGQAEIELDKLGRIFIDRNPNLFEFMLEYLRKEKIHNDLTDSELETVLTEAEFYRLNSLVDLIKAKQLERSEIVDINVGGTNFSTLRSALVKKIANSFEPNMFYEAHLLEKMINGQVASRRDKNGAIFIDRDPAPFLHILNYLRYDFLILSSHFFKLI